jgi:hypothetical protein
MAYRTNLKNDGAKFAEMMNDGFGIVTVMNAYVCDALSSDALKKVSAYDIAKLTLTEGEDVEVKAAGERIHVYCKLDTLKIANVTQEGPTKTITGGQYSNPLIKFGKTARLEMQDALGNAAAIEALCGGIREFFEDISDSNLTGLHFGEDFAGPKMIIGESFFIDRKWGKQVNVKIIFYQFLPDSIFNLTQDAEGDATVFDMNGDLLTSEILLGQKEGVEKPHGVFYSIVSGDGDSAPYTITNAAGNVGITELGEGETAQHSVDDGGNWTEGAIATKVAKGHLVRFRVLKNGKIIYSTSAVSAENPSSN